MLRRLVVENHRSDAPPPLEVLVHRVRDADALVRPAAPKAFPCVRECGKPKQGKIKSRGNALKPRFANRPVTQHYLRQAGRPYLEQ